jgi:hypothetical protein
MPGQEVLVGDALPGGTTLENALDDLTDSSRSLATVGR